MELYFGNPISRDYETLIASMPDGEFKNLTRSTIPLLTYWRSPEQQLAAICSQLGVGVPADVRLYFEYAVASVKRAKPSFTDVMAISKELCIAVEGKSTEPEYDPIRVWKTKIRSDWQYVLKHWLAIIARRTGVNFPEDLTERFSDLIYQTIHRTASACSVDCGRTAVVYQVFKVEGEQLPDYRSALHAMAAAVGALGKLDLLVQTVPTRRTEAYATLQEALLEMDKDARPDLIRQAVLDGELFQFGEPQWEFVSRWKPA